MNQSILYTLTDRELLRCIDRDDPFVAELASRLEAALDEIEVLDPKAEKEEEK